MSRLIFLWLFCPAIATAQGQLLSDVDLKAAYCIPVARLASQTNVTENMPESFKNSLRDTKNKGDVNLRRLNLYLLPRLSQLDVMPLIGALKSAEEDLARSKADSMKCGSMSTDRDVLQCIAVETQTLKRLRSCDVLNFLPF